MGLAITYPRPSPLTQPRHLVGAVVTAVFVAALLVGGLSRSAVAAANGCAIPGNDGPVPALGGIVNTYYPAAASRAAGATSIQVGTPTGAATPIAAGDMLLVVQMQDSAIDSSNTGSYGDGVLGDPGSGSTNLRSTGLYEYVRAATAVTAGSVSILGAGAGNGLVNAYDEAAATGTDGQRTFQVVRVPQYSSATLTSGLTAATWDGATGGVLAIDVAGSLDLGGATVSLDGLGFRGAAGRQLNGDNTAGAGDYRFAAPGPSATPIAGAHASKGEGTAGTPRYLFTLAIHVVDTGVDGYPNGSMGRGAPGNAGGGGSDSDVATNQENSGGGGGGNGGAGGVGGDNWQSGDTFGGFGGVPASPAAARLTLGGGGGAGTRNNDTGDDQASSGAAGGGLAFVRAGSAANTGTIRANGSAAYNNTLNDGGGGGGAGGAILFTAATGNLSGLTLQAAGGRGGDAWDTQASGGATLGNRHGPGGGGGGGVVFTSSAAASADVSGGANGVTTLAADAFGALPGSAGVTGTVAPALVPGIGAGAACLPQLTVMKTTTTPTVVQTTSGTSAAYTINVTNAGGQGDAINTAISDTLPNSPNFTYASTVLVSLSGGATRGPTVDPVAGSTNPSWGTFSIPGGGTVQVTFNVNITAAAALGTYRNPATATYSDPTRVAAAGTTSAGFGPGAPVTLVAPDMTIVKGHNPATFVRGSTGAFLLTATNSGNASSSGAVTVTDAVPATLPVTGASGPGWDCAATAGQAVSCTRSDSLSAGNAYPAITVSVNVGQGALNPTSNTAVVAGGGELNPNNDSAADRVPLNASADIQVTKTVDNASPNLGGNVVFTIKAKNNGPSDATGVNLFDPLPPGLAFVGSSATAGSYDSTTGTWTIGAIANGATDTLTITATVTQPGQITNTASKANENETDPDTANDSSSVQLSPQAADIAVTKMASNSTPNFGSQVVFTLTAHNNGAADASGVVVHDQLPPGLVYVSSGPSQGSYDAVAGDWGVGALANGATATLTITSTVNTTGQLTNTATRTASSPPDPNRANDSAQAVINVPAAADIAVTKKVDNATPNVGANVLFTVTAHNNGPDAATGVALDDLLPPGLTYVSAVPTPGSYNQATGVWTIGNLANGADATLALTATVTQAGPLTNTASKRTEDQFDPNTGNDMASAALAGQPAADIAITKTAGAASAPVGQQVTFTVKAHNNGPSQATSVHVTDALPVGLAFVSAAPSQGGYDAPSGLWNVGTLNNGAEATLAITATVTQTGPLTNTATKSAEDQVDPNANNNSDAVTITGLPAADIQVHKVVDNPTPNLNANVTFTVTVHNAGPNGATGVEITDVMPGGLSLVSSNPSQGSYAAGVWTVGTLANGADATLAITAKVIQTGAQTNTATKTKETEFDPDLTNDHGSASVNAPPSADIVVSKQVDNPAPNLGSQVVFTVTAHNAGPDQATGVHLGDLLPAGLVLVSSNPSQGTYDSASGAWVVGSLANGASATLGLTATVTATGTITNNAAVTAEDQQDPTPLDDHATAQVVVPPAADIAVTDVVDHATAGLGTNVTFTVTAHNNGPDIGHNVQLTDLLPPGLTFVSATTSQGGYVSGTGLWTVGTINVGSGATLTITATTTQLGTLTDMAAKTGETEFDPNTSNDSASAAVDVQPLADIEVTKMASTTTPTVGTDVTFTITAINHGPSPAVAVAVTDRLPAGLAFVAATPTQGTYDATTGTWTVGDLGNGASASLVVSAGVTASGQTTNTATKTGETTADPNPANDTASVTLSPRVVDLALKKAASGNFIPGSNAAYTLQVTNVGTAPTFASITVSDTLPPLLSYVSAGAAGWTCSALGQAVSCVNPGPIEPGASSTINLTVSVGHSAGGTITNQATVNTAGDVSSANDTSSAATPIVLAAPPSGLLLPLQAPLGGLVLGLYLLGLDAVDRWRPRLRR